MPELAGVLSLWWLQIPLDPRLGPAADYEASSDSYLCCGAGARAGAVARVVAKALWGGRQIFWSGGCVAAADSLAPTLTGGGGGGRIVVVVGGIGSFLRVGTGLPAAPFGLYISREYEALSWGGAGLCFFLCFFFFFSFSWSLFLFLFLRFVLGQRTEEEERKNDGEKEWPPPLQCCGGCGWMRGRGRECECEGRAEVEYDTQDRRVWRGGVLIIYVLDYYCNIPLIGNMGE